MSEPFSNISNIKFHQKIQISNSHSPKFVNRSDVDETKVVLTLTVSNLFLRNLNKAKSDYDFSFIELLNTQLSFFQLKIAERLENRLKTLCSRVINDFRRINGGRQRQEFNSRKHNFAVFKDEIEDVRDLNHSISIFKEENVELEARTKELFKEITRLRNRVTDLKNEIQDLTSQNKQLVEYIDKFLCGTPMVNSGKSIENLSSRQTRRKIKTLETHAQKCLWFAETFGIIPEKMLCKSTTGENIALNLNNSQDFADFSKLSEIEKRKLREIVFIMDKFCVSDAAYHELSMISQDLPRSYMLVQSRNDINDIFHIERLPGNVPGAYINLHSELRRLLQNKISKHDGTCDRVSVKFSGDGAKVSRISNFITFSISLVSDNTSLSYNEQCTVGIVKCGENYDNLLRTSRPIFDQLSDLTSKRKIDINGTEVDFDVFVGGDLKFVQIILGLNGSTANYACPWCKVHKDDRHDTTKCWDYYHGTGIKRTITELNSIASSGKNEYGVKHRPLLTTPIDHYIPDELHLMMRITDVLLRNLIDDAIDNDSKKLDDLIQLINSCGVSFDVWTPKETTRLEWTSLSGAERVKVLKELPQKLVLSDVLNSDSKHMVADIWESFLNLYRFINSTSCTEVSGVEIFNKIRIWIDNFKVLGKYRKGHRKLNITPYMHCFLYHVPYFINSYGSLKKFSGQAVEKNNDIVKMIHQKKSNKWDAACETLKVRKRIEYGQSENLQREKRDYNKTSDWWETGLRQQRKSKRKAIDEEIENADAEYCENKNNDSLTDFELRQLLRKKGISTKVRKREKLIAMLLDHTEK